MSFFQIPGNIKQQFLPFVLQPDANLNLTVKKSPELTDKCSPQYFSYRINSGSSQTFSGSARLNFFPSSIQSIHIDDDISFKLLYGYDYYNNDNDNPAKKSITVQDILNTIPGVQIREFLPDTRLDQCINLFCDMFKNMTKLFSQDVDAESSTGQNQNTSVTEKIGLLFKKFNAVADFTMNYMVGSYPNGEPSLSKDIGNVSGTKFSSYKGKFVNDSSVSNSVLSFPYALYYRLQSCVTTGIYEVPATSSDKTVITSQGDLGWTGGGDALETGEFRMSGLLGKIPLIGSLVNMVLGNIGINYMPWWNSDSGTKTKEPEVEIKFDLYNDSAEAAMINFIFVNTIVPSNKWIQYNMFQHSSHLYDVKIEGINRLFACAGSFTVTYEGVLRYPPPAWIHNLVNKYANLNMNKESFEANIIKNRLIKIPDVYRVTMKFTSLLPSNFNNFIYVYSENNNQIETYAKHVYDQSTIAEAVPKALKSFSDRVVKVWQAGKDIYLDNKYLSNKKDK